MLSSFHGFLIFGAMSIMLLIGMFLRAKVRFFQTNMIPASLIGGVLGFILVGLGWMKYVAPDGAWVTITAGDFLPFTFHAFNISFISLCLTRSQKAAGGNSSILKGGLWLAFAWTASLSLQALVGGGAVAVYNLFTGGDTSPFIGMLSTHGFTQGPGQALATGRIWEQNFGIQDATTLGLIWAAIGFIVAYTVGVPWAKHFVRQGLNANQRSSIDEDFLTGILKQENQLVGGKETTHSSTLETLAFHMAIIGVVYVITYAEITIMRGFVKHFMFSYPMFFFHGLCWAVVVRKLIAKLGISYLTDPGIQKRITGLSVDYLLVASIMGISLTVLGKYIGVIVVVTIALAIVTFLMIYFFQKRLTELGPERSVAIFGCCCGSTASGLLLLRILDPDYSTSVGMELAFFNVAILFTSFPIGMLMAPALPSYGVWAIIGAYGLSTLVCFAAMWFLGPWKKGESVVDPAAVTVNA